MRTLTARRFLLSFLVPAAFLFVAQAPCRAGGFMKLGNHQGGGHNSPL